MTFSVGDRIPADIRLITANSLEIDESALTGETRPARKNIEICERGEGEDTHGEGGGKALGERHCMAFMGTLVRSGASFGPPSPCDVLKSRQWLWNSSGHGQRHRVWSHFLHDARCEQVLQRIMLTRPGGGEEDATSGVHGRSGQATIDLLVRCHWCHLSSWSVAKSRLVGNVHHRR